MVRKRKNSEESVPALPRLTRLRRNLEEEGDAESTLTETSTKSSRTPKTPSARKQNTRKKNLIAHEDSTMSTRSQRVRVIKSSSDSDVENRGDESKGIESYPTRSRTRKEGGNSTIVNDMINLTTENLTEGIKRHVPKRKRVLAAADNTLTENQSPIKTLGKSTRSHSKIISTSVSQVADDQEVKMPNPAQNSPSEVKNKKNKIIDTPRKVSPRKQSTSLVKMTSETITPESSPMLVNLTPHRSNKTPKKSPMNIGSPKTHSQSPLRLSKTPRKLTINVESPATSDKSSLSNQSLKQANNSVTSNRRDPFVVLTDFKKDASPRIEKSTEFESEEETQTSFVSEVKLQLRKLPVKKRTGVDSSLKLDEQNSPANSKRKLSPGKKPGILGSKVRKSPTKTPASIRKSGSSQIQTPKRTPPNLGQSNPVNPESPKRPKSTTKKRSPGKSSGTPLRPIIERKESSVVENICSPNVPKKMHLLMQLKTTSPESTPKSRIRRSLHLTPDFVKFSSGSTSSPIFTPKRTSKLSNSSMNFPGFEESKMIKDISLELIDASSLMEDVSKEVSSNSIKPCDGTYELLKPEEAEGETGDKLEQSEVKDSTYELAEPKTPSLKKQSRKRSLSQIEPGKSTPEAKKICRVRFASPTKQKTPNSVRKSLPTVNTPAKQRIGGRSSRLNLAPDSSRRRSRSLTKIDEKPAAQRGNIKRRSISASDLTNKTPKLNRSTQDSVNRLSKPRQSISSGAKLEIKVPVPRKAPNFAQIHQKKFAEMESLVDAKKRVAKRHEELNTLPSSRSFQASSATVPEPAAQDQSSKKPVPTDSQDGKFNRFGFKLRKAEAMRVVTKKPAAATKSKNYQENNRSILKGVRINRRFELQMKARNINQ